MTRILHRDLFHCLFHRTWEPPPVCCLSVSRLAKAPLGAEQALDGYSSRPSLGQEDHSGWKKKSLEGVQFMAGPNFKGLKKAIHFKLKKSTGQMV